MSTETKHTPKDFIAFGLLDDAAFQLSQLTGENLLAYARTFAVLARTAVKQSQYDGKFPVVATTDELTADAHLIAAAPDLLAALEELLGCARGNSDPMHVHWTERCKNKAHAAIAKAGGAL